MKIKAEFLNSIPVIVNVNVKVNLDSQPHAPTKMGRCWWLPYYINVYTILRLFWVNHISIFLFLPLWTPNAGQHLTLRKSRFSLPNLP